MRKLAHIALVACGVLVLAGCSNDSGPPPSAPAKAADKLKSAFTAADARIQNVIESASKALKEAKYDQAYLSLEAVKSERNLTPQQMAAVQESMQSLQSALSEAIVRGDSNALRTVLLIRGSPGGPR
jgi:PBP1b-binding outer membrane lipoprotein LpoB